MPAPKRIIRFHVKKKTEELNATTEEQDLCRYFASHTMQGIQATTERSMKTMKGPVRMCDWCADFYDGMAPLRSNEKE